LPAGFVERSLQIHADMRLAFASAARKIPARQLFELFCGGSWAAGSEFRIMKTGIHRPCPKNQMAGPQAG
jgi:hypothetical protein